MSGTSTSDYTFLNATLRNNLQYLTEFYSERATDKSRIEYFFRNTGIQIEILVHKKIPAPIFKNLMFKWMRSRNLDHVASDDGEVEISVVKRFNAVDKKPDSESQGGESVVEEGRGGTEEIQG